MSNKQWSHELVQYPAFDAPGILQTLSYPTTIACQGRWWRRIHKKCANHVNRQRFTATLTAFIRFLVFYLTTELVIRWFHRKQEIL